MDCHELEHHVAPLPVGRAVIEHTGGAVDAGIRNRNVVANEERPDTEVSPGAGRSSYVVDRIRDLDGILNRATFPRRPGTLTR